MKSSKKNMLILVFSVVFVSVIALGITVFGVNTDLIEASVYREKVFEVHLDNVSATTTGNATYTLPRVEDTSLNDFYVQISTNTDSVVYTFTIKNKGDYDAVLSSISKFNPDCSGGSITDNRDVCNNLVYKLTYNNGSKVKNGDILDAGTTRTMNLTIKTTSKNVITSPVLIKDLDIMLNYNKK